MDANATSRNKSNVIEAILYNPLLPSASRLPDISRLYANDPYKDIREWTIRVHSFDPTRFIYGKMGYLVELIPLDESLHIIHMIWFPKAVIIKW